MKENVQNFIYDLIFSVYDSEFSFLISNTYGFLLPAFLSIIIFIFMEKKDERKIYGLAYLVSVAFIFIMIFFNFGYEMKETKVFSSLHFVSIYPLIILISFFYHAERYSIRKPINAGWMFIGTFSSLSITDFCLSYILKGDDFRFEGIGGAGIFDGLLIATLLAWIPTLLINKAIIKKYG